MKKLIPKFQHSGKLESDNTKTRPIYVPEVGKENYTPKVSLLTKYAELAKNKPQQQFTSDNRTKEKKAVDDLKVKDLKRRKELAKTDKVIGTAAALGGLGIAQMIPGINTVVNTGLGIVGGMNLLSDNGIKKTADAIHEGDYLTAVQSGVGDLLDLGILRLGTKSVRNIPNNFRRVLNSGQIAFNNFRVNRFLGKPIVPEKFTELTPQTRFKLGDVEINNPQLAYRQGKGLIKDFQKSGKVRTHENKNYGSRKIGRFNFGKSFENPMFAQGTLWYGIPTKYGSELLTTAEPLSLATKSSAGVKSTLNGTFDVRYNTNSSNIGTRRILVKEGQLTPENTSTYIFDPSYGYRRVTSNSPRTYLGLLERPSKVNNAEKLGIPKGERNNLSLNLKDAISDLFLYINSGQHRQVFRVSPDWELFGWNLSEANPTFMLLFAADGEAMRGSLARVLLLTQTGKGVLSYNPERNMAGYSSRSFPTPDGFKYAPGEASMNIDGLNGLKIILTSPRVDFLDGVVEESVKQLNENLSNTINKPIMKDFWINSRKAQRPGTYLSGDNGAPPLGSILIQAFKNRKLHETPILEKPIEEQLTRRTGLSPDSYSSIIRQGNRDGSLRYGEGFLKWNNSAVENKYIEEAYDKYMKGDISKVDYTKIFNDWSLKIGGRPLQWLKIENGTEIPIHPHPYIYAKKYGGKL